MNNDLNIQRIKVVWNALDDLKNKVVFVGGATISLYPDRQIIEARPTFDIDVIIEIFNYGGRAELEEKLRSKGFLHDTASQVVCRFRIKEIIVDIMPTNDPSIGFNSMWYPDGFKHAIDYKIDEENSIRILSAPYFIATKMEAYKDRGKNDGRTSKDFEDIVYILKNREIVWEEMNNSEAGLKDYLQKEFNKLLNNSEITEWIDCHVERGSPPATDLIIDKLKKFC